MCFSPFNPPLTSPKEKNKKPQTENSYKKPINQEVLVSRSLKSKVYRKKKNRQTHNLCFFKVIFLGQTFTQNFFLYLLSKAAAKKSNTNLKPLFKLSVQKRMKKNL